MLEIAALFGLAAVAAAAGPARSWPVTLTPHFEVLHEKVWLPGGFTMGLERVHSRLRLDLAAFSPWMAGERVKLFVYAGREGYVSGELSPPAWSNGLAVYQRRLVAVYDQPGRKLLEIVAHETTHLLFESYWGEANKRPPAWLNEGLAMVEEAQATGSPEASPWYRAMAAGQPLPDLAHLTAISPMRDIKDAQGAEAAQWYGGAFSVVYFLLHTHTRLQFKTFVGHLRDGDDLRRALWSSYGYASLERFEADWRRWAHTRTSSL